jgi:hypothetical protein
MKLTCDYHSGKAVLRFGEIEVFVSCDHPDHAPPKVFDFALFAGTALGLQHAADIEVDLPVSRRAVDHLDEILDAYQCWCYGRIPRPRIVASTIVEDDALDADGPYRGLFLSGGVDSVYSLVSGRPTPDPTHAVLIHGIDYLETSERAFDELRPRVERICEKAGLTLVEMRTDIRTAGRIRYEAVNTLVLAMCAHVLGERFRSVALSADNSQYEEYVMLPWSNSFLGQRLSGGGLRVEYGGHDVTKFRKVERIVADGRFVEDLSICWADQTKGTNCGKCGKCLHARATLELLGVDTTDLFDDHPDIVTELRKLRTPRRVLSAEGFFLRFLDLHNACPPGELKDVLADLARRGYHAARRESNPSRKHGLLSRLLWRLTDAL